jgi:hypothetical protein
MHHIKATILFVIAIIIGGLCSLSSYVAFDLITVGWFPEFLRWTMLVINTVGAALFGVLAHSYYPSLVIGSMSDKELAKFAEVLSREVDRRTR